MSGHPVVGGAEARAVQAAATASVVARAVASYGPVEGLRAVRAMRRAAKPFADAFGPVRVVRAGRRWWPRFLLPSWPSPTFDRWADVRLAEAVRGTPDESYLSLVFLGVTARCGLGCQHCSAADELAEVEPIPIESWIHQVHTLQERGLMQLQLTGGEPMGRFDDVLSLLRSMRPGTDTWMNTSGVGLTPSRAQELADAGLVGVLVSIDHWDPARHNAFRGGHPHVFDQAVAACRAAADAGLVVAVSPCPTRADLTPEWLDRMHGLAGALGAAYLRFVEPRAAGRWRGLEVDLTPAQVALLEAFEHAANADPARAHLPVVVNYDRLSRALGCPGAGDRSLYLDAHGQARSCPFCGSPQGDVFALGLDAVRARLRTGGCGRHRSARPLAAAGA